MSKIHNAIMDIRRLEELAERKTIIHRLHPMAKLITTILYLIMVVSYDRYAIAGLLPYSFYTIILMALSETPYKPLFYRLLVVLPFSLFAGISNIIFDSKTAMFIGNIAISYGMISFLSIIIKTVLTVMAVLILISTTSMLEIAYQLIYLKMPEILVMQLLMIYRYITVLLEEAWIMTHSYLLRSPRHKGIEMKHMGGFLGQLLIRSMDRAERIFYAMKCRGMNLSYQIAHDHKGMNKSDNYYVIGISVLLIAFRLFNISMLIGTSIYQ